VKRILVVAALVAGGCVTSGGSADGADGADEAAGAAVASAEAATPGLGDEAAETTGVDRANEAADQGQDEVLDEVEAGSASTSGGLTAHPDRARPPIHTGDYLEPFDSADSVETLDYFVANGRDYNNRPTSWPADHAAGGDCGGPFTTRTISWPDPEGPDLRTTTIDPGETVYWCAPGGEGTGHLMTTFHTKGYAHLDFSPRKTFVDVRQVCYDANATNLGNRQWHQVVVVDAGLAAEVAPRLDWTKPSFLENGPGSAGLHPTEGVFLFTTTLGGASVLSNGTVEGKGSKTDKSVADTKKRVTTCLIDRGDGQIEITQERWGGAVDVTVLPGSFPPGEVRVVFQDLSYNPDKAINETAPLFAGYTWHWDNLFVSSEAGPARID
jgi:hypothetical protein